jgi:anaerobic selenocysteine-containing dehydrogenase
MAKRVVELDDEAVPAARSACSTAISSPSTPRLRRLRADLRAESWDVLLAESGVARADRGTDADLCQGQAVIATWGMGLTQHKHSVATIQMLSNLMMMRGHRQAGRGPVPGARPLERAGRPHHGHRGTADQAFLDRLEQVFGFEPPRHHGYDAVAPSPPCWRKVKVFVAWAAISRWPRRTRRAPSRRCACDLTVHIATKLNRSHLVHGRER